MPDTTKLPTDVIEAARLGDLCFLYLHDAYCPTDQDFRDIENILIRYKAVLLSNAEAVKRLREAVEAEVRRRIVNPLYREDIEIPAKTILDAINQEFPCR